MTLYTPASPRVFFGVITFIGVSGHKTPAKGNEQKPPNQKQPNQKPPDKKHPRVSASPDKKLPEQ